MRKETTRDRMTIIKILFLYGDEMRAAAGWRENDIMSRADEIEISKENGFFVFDLYAPADADGHRDGAQYHTGRHTWTG